MSNPHDEHSPTIMIPTKWQIQHPYRATYSRTIFGNSNEAIEPYKQYIEPVPKISLCADATDGARQAEDHRALLCEWMTSRIMLILYTAQIIIALVLRRIPVAIDDPIEAALLQIEFDRRHQLPKPS